MVEVWRDKEPIVIERSRLQGGDEILQSTWGMQGFVVMGTMIVTNANNSVLDAVRESIEKQNLETSTITLSATLINDVLICRVLANQAEAARESFIDIWKTLRPLVLQRDAVAPRIWYT